MLRWLGGTRADQLYLSAITISEIQRGIESKRQDDQVKAREIEIWLEDDVLAGFQILPLDAAAAREWSRLIHGQPSRLIYDAMIAAIANVNQLTVVTRNTRDFTLLGVLSLNPFELVP